MVMVPVWGMPSKSQAADSPVPEPSSRNLPPGLDAARVRKKEHVSGSDAMLKPIARVARQMEDVIWGSLMFFASFICIGFADPMMHRAGLPSHSL